MIVLDGELDERMVDASIGIRYISPASKQQVTCATSWPQLEWLPVSGGAAHIQG